MRAWIDVVSRAAETPSADETPNTHYLDEELAVYFAEVQGRFEREVRHGVVHAFGDDVYAEVTVRKGSLVIEVVLATYAAAKTFKDVMTLLGWFADFLEKVTRRDA